MPLIPDAAKIQKSVAMLPVARYEPGEMVIAAGATTGKLLLLRQGVVEVVRDGTQITRISEPSPPSCTWSERPARRAPREEVRKKRLLELFALRHGSAPSKRHASARTRRTGS
jgi:hypothetical protein